MELSVSKDTFENNFISTESHRALEEFSAPLMAGQSIKVLVKGETGIGKSVSLYNFVQKLSSNDNLLILEGYSTRYGSLYYPIGTALSDLVKMKNKKEGIIDVSSEVTKTLVSTVLKYTIGLDVAEVLQSVKKNYTDKPKENFGFDKLDVIFEVQHMLTLASKKKHVLLIFHDIEFYDNASLEILAHLIQHLSNCSFVFSIDPYRFNYERKTEKEIILNFERDLCYDFDFQTITYKNFTMDETTRFIKLVAKSEEVNDTIIKFIHKVSGGYPAAVKEYIKYCLSLKLDNIDKIQKHTPENLPDLIKGRLALLDAEERIILDIASVIGDSFSHEPINYIQEKKIDSLFVQLRSLCDEYGFVKALPQSDFDVCESEYMFTNSFIRNSTYRLLSKAQIKYYHGKLAEFFEKDNLQCIGNYGLYLHHRYAGNNRKALTYLVKSAEEAFNKFAHWDAAVRYADVFAYATTIKFDFEGNELALLYLKAGNSFYLAGKRKESIHYLKKAINGNSSNEIVAESKIILGSVYFINDQNDLGIQILNDVINNQKSDLTKKNLMQARLFLANLYFHDENWTGANEQYTSACEEAQDFDDIKFELVKRINMYLIPELCLNKLLSAINNMDQDQHLLIYWEIKHNLAATYIAVGDFDTAETILHECIGFFVNNSNYRAGFSYNNLSCIHMFKGNYKLALEYSYKATENSVTGIQFRCTNCNTGIALALNGNLEESRAVLEKLYNEIPVTADNITKKMVAHNLGWCYKELGEFDKAYDLIEEGIVANPAPKNSFKIGQAQRLLKAIELTKVQSSNDSQNLYDELSQLNNSGRKDATIYREFDFQYCDLWIWR